MLDKKLILRGFSSEDHIDSIFYRKSLTKATIKVRQLTCCGIGTAAVYCGAVKLEYFEGEWEDVISKIINWINDFS
jgi:hypothetical protein